MGGGSPGELLGIGYCAASRPSQPVAVVEEAQESIGEGSAVEAIDGETRPAVVDDVTQSADIGSDHGQSARLGLCGDQTERLAPRRHDEHVGCSIEVGEQCVGLGWEEVDSIADARLCGDPLQVRKLLSPARTARPADDEKTGSARRCLDPLRQFGHSFHGDIDSFVRLDSSGVQHDRLVSEPQPLARCLPITGAEYEVVDSGGETCSFAALAPYWVTRSWTSCGVDATTASDLASTSSSVSSRIGAAIGSPGRRVLFLTRPSVWKELMSGRPVASFTSTPLQPDSQ